MGDSTEFARKLITPYAEGGLSMIDDMIWKQVKQEVGELAHMEHEMLQARGSRDHWKAKCERMEKDLYKRYVELPADADGEVIHVGDSVEFIGGEDGKVVAVELGESGWSVSVVPAGWDTPTLSAPSSLLRRYDRTVEDVLCEFADAISGQNEDFGSLIVKRYADEIRQMLDD